MELYSFRADQLGPVLTYAAILGASELSATTPTSSVHMLRVWDDKADTYAWTERTNGGAWTDKDLAGCFVRTRATVTFLA